MNISAIPSHSYSDPYELQRPASSLQKQAEAQKTTTNEASSGTQHKDPLVQQSQVAQMAQLGESASSIAIITGVPVSEVEVDLGISTAASAASTVASAASANNPATVNAQQPRNPAEAANSAATDLAGIHAVSTTPKLSVQA